VVSDLSAAGARQQAGVTNKREKAAWASSKETVMNHCRLGSMARRQSGMTGLARRHLFYQHSLHYLSAPHNKNRSTSGLSLYSNERRDDMVVVLVRDRTAQDISVLIRYRLWTPSTSSNILMIRSHHLSVEMERRYLLGAFVSTKERSGHLCSASLNNAPLRPRLLHPGGFMWMGWMRTLVRHCWERISDRRRRA